MSADVHATREGNRLESVDALRGLVMVIMVLDHVRDFFGDVRVNPTNPETTDALLFFTRWITHYCAPVFVLLAGTGAGLSAFRKTRPELSAGLLKRGLLLILLEVTLIRFGMTFDPTFAFIPLTVVWVIGLSMVCLSGLVFLPTWAVALFGLILVAGHNYFDHVNVGDPASPQGMLWTLLHRRGMLGSILGRRIFLLYPLVPWVGVMALGYGLASVLRLESARRRRILIGLGLALVAGFVALRSSRLYGDPQPFTTFGEPIRTLFSFLNVEKYPPSLLYLMMTLGPALIFLGLADGRDLGRAGRFLLPLGREPLFYYVLQWYLIHILAIVVAAALGRPFLWMIGGGPFGAPPDYGYGLGFVYVMWGVTVAILHAATAGFAEIKRRRKRATTKPKPIEMEEWS